LRNFTIGIVSGTEVPFLVTGEYKYAFTVTDSGRFDKIVLQMNVTVFIKGASLSIGSL
jgi:hypothetical protein